MMDWHPMDWLNLAHMTRPLWIVWMVVLFLGAFFYALRPRNKRLFEDCAQIPFRTDSENNSHE
jgi:cytochrome c oxidase cbb3-type subunit IV